MNRKAPGRRPYLDDEQRAEFARLVEAGPAPDKDGVVLWRRIDLKGKIEELFGARMHERTVGKQLSELGFAKMTVRPQHPKADVKAQEAFKACPHEGGENFAHRVGEVLPEAAKGKPLEIWFQDEARVGQQGTLTRIWARRGTRPRAPRDRRYDWAYLFGAVCPQRCATAALVMPRADAKSLSKHLAEISREVAAGAHAVLVLDGAGYHIAADLDIPANITLLQLPPYAPELNPVENIWQYLRANKLAISVCVA